jgi:SAM-dependent methyltransferase
MSVNELSDRVSAHYTPAHLMQAFESVLQARANDSGRVTPGDLAPVDQFHFGGGQATIELAAFANLGPGTPVLDIGGGFGGPARTLADTYGCPVTVLDLTEAYCDVGEKLTARCGLQDLVSFQQGDALAIPLADKSFPRVWTQHSSMNIADKQQLYREIHRVLRPGGRLALYEVMAGTAGASAFPCAVGRRGVDQLPVDAQRDAAASRRHRLSHPGVGRLDGRCCRGDAVEAHDCKLARVARGPGRRLPRTGTQHGEELRRASCRTRPRGARATMRDNVVETDTKTGGHWWRGLHERIRRERTNAS